MTKYYIKVDKDTGFPDKSTAPALKAADDLTEVEIPTTSIQYFTRYWWLYAILDGGGVQAPGNLPDLSIDGLQSVIDQQGAQLATALDTITAQAKQLEQLNTLLPQVQKMVVSMTQAQTQSDATVKQLQTLGMQLTQQLTLVQQAQTTTKEGE